MTNTPEARQLTESETHDLLQKALTQYAGVLKKMGAGVMPTASEVGPAMEMIRGELDRMRGLLAAKEAECQRLRELFAVSEVVCHKNGEDARVQKNIANAAISAKNSAYLERTKLIAALAKLFPASIEIDPNAESPEWENVVFIDFPTGQASWHIFVREIDIFSFLHRNAGRTWDGHTTDEKYARISALKPRI